METELRVYDGMDILKDITRGLRGRDESQQSEHSRTTIDSQSDRVGRNSTDDSDGSGDESNGSAGDSEEAAERSNGSTDDSTELAASPKGDMNHRSEDSDHVCSFCQTEFDANRGDCPDCGATLVLRGDR